MGQCGFLAPGVDFNGRLFELVGLELQMEEDLSADLGIDKRGVFWYFVWYLIVVFSAQYSLTSWTCFLTLVCFLEFWPIMAGKDGESWRLSGPSSKSLESSRLSPLGERRITASALRIRGGPGWVRRLLRSRRMKRA